MAKGVPFRIRKHGIATPCPKCGNDSEFTARSGRCAEDCCELWIECKCGYDPTAESAGDRVEDVWGDLCREKIPMLTRNWNDVIAEQVTRAGSGITPSFDRPWVEGEKP